MAVDYLKLQSKALDLIQNVFGEGGQTCTLTTVDGNTAAGYIVFTTADTTDESVADVGNVSSTVRTAYVNNLTVEPCPGDTITTNSVSYRVIDSRKYKPAVTNVAYRLTLTV